MELSRLNLRLNGLSCRLAVCIKLSWTSVRFHEWLAKLGPVVTMLTSSSRHLPKFLHILVREPVLVIYGVSSVTCGIQTLRVAFTSIYLLPK